MLFCFVFSLHDGVPMGRLYFKYLIGTITSWAFNRVPHFQQNQNISLCLFIKQLVYVYRTIEAPLKLLKWVNTNHVQM